MKFLKLLFSKILVSALLFLLQLVLIFVVVVYFNTYFVAFQVVSVLFAIYVIIFIINKKESPEFKLPWLFIVLVFPLFGLLVYALFANPKMRKGDLKLLKAIHVRTEKYTLPSTAEQEELSQKLQGFNGIEKYLQNNAFMHGHFNNRVTYFSVGEDFWQDLLLELEKAEKYIFMEYFIIDHGTMWDSIHEILRRKAEMGIEVRLMYDDIGTVGKLRSGYFKKLRQEGINCYKFNPFRPVISGIYNNRDHRKITVIDGKVGYTGGVNLGDEYINKTKPLGHWKDTAVKIEGSAVNNLNILFLQAFDINAKQISNYQRYLDVQHEQFSDEGYVHPFGDGPKPYYKEQIGEQNYINLINRAERYVYITTPYLILDHNLTTTLRNAAFRGVDVRIIVPHIPDKRLIFNMTRSNYPSLLEAGVKIFEYTPGFIHAKSLVADDEYAFVGTINLDYRSLVHHYECGAVLYKNRCVQDILRDIRQTLEVSQQITRENFRMSRLARVANAVLALFAPML